MFQICSSKTIKNLHDLSIYGYTNIATKQLVNLIPTEQARDNAVKKKLDTGHKKET